MALGWRPESEQDLPPSKRDQKENGSAQEHHADPQTLKNRRETRTPSLHALRTTQVRRIHQYRIQFHWDLECNGTTFFTECIIRIALDKDALVFHTKTQISISLQSLNLLSEILLNIPPPNMTETL